MNKRRKHPPHRFILSSPTETGATHRARPRLALRIFFSSARKVFDACVSHGRMRRLSPPTRDIDTEATFFASTRTSTPPPPSPCHPPPPSRHPHRRGLAGAPRPSPPHPSPLPHCVPHPRVSRPGGLAVLVGPRCESRPIPSTSPCDGGRARPSVPPIQERTRKEETYETSMSSTT